MDVKDKIYLESYGSLRKSLLELLKMLVIWVLFTKDIA
jgi:hypothetical protein